MGTSELHLRGLEQSLLYLLAANAGCVVTRHEILDSLWGTDYVAESNVVDRQIRNLRTRSWTTGGGATFHCHGPTPGLPFPSHLHV
jgi:DNA-binding response OmpR family regulator